ncbi:MAG: hypothetical protein DSY92_08120 [Planctomycetota bacterium]|nr:MAG: hypothetical protein DSY92_08120 [Planctomycetota bacterium]
MQLLVTCSLFQISGVRYGIELSVAEVGDSFPRIGLWTPGWAALVSRNQKGILLRWTQWMYFAVRSWHFPAVSS